MTLAQQFRQEGIEEGIQTGIEEGIQKGIQKGRREGITKGSQKGIDEGIQKGRREARIGLLRRLLQRRFGELPAWVEVRLAEGAFEDLGQWSERILDAAQIEEVFA